MAAHRPSSIVYRPVNADRIRDALYLKYAACAEEPMTTLLGIISVEQEQSFFAERYFREIITVASQTITGNDCYLRIMPPLPALADPATIHAQLISQGIAGALVIAPDEALIGQLTQTFRAM